MKYNGNRVLSIGKVWVNSAKKYCDLVEEIPEGAIFFKTANGYLRQHEIAEDVRKGYVLYHTHRVGGANKYCVNHYHYDLHDVYIIKAV